MSDAVYVRDGGRLVPTEKAGSPWGAGTQHGGPACGLLARAIEHACPHDELQPVRLSVDLFRPIPMQPLTARAEILRRGSRIAVVAASLFANDTEVTRATGLLLRRSQTAPLEEPVPLPPGPDGLETSWLVPLERRDDVPPGFHSSVEARFVRGEGHPRPALWIRLPMPLVDGEPLSPFQRAAAVADFSNALGSMWRRRARPDAVGFINTDSTLYLARPPEGEWLCLESDHLADRDGIGVVEVVQHDASGRFGRVLQARLANPRTPPRRRARQGDTS